LKHAGVCIASCHTCRTPHGVRGLKQVHWRSVHRGHLSHPARGAWIETVRSRSKCSASESHPARGAWIETRQQLVSRCAATASHPARGAWIETRLRTRSWTCRRSRTPHGVRGLKRHAPVLELDNLGSHPARGAWIETCNWRDRGKSWSSHPARGAWIETCNWRDRGKSWSSHPARGAWIETNTSDAWILQRTVAPRTGCVD